MYNNINCGQMLALQSVKTAKVSELEVQMDKWK